MRLIPEMRRGVVFRGLAWSATTVAMALLWAQTPVQPALAVSYKSTAPVAPNSADQKPSEPGVWHHFDERQPVPSAETRPSGVWRHFGEGGNPPPSSHETPTWRSLGLKRSREMEQLMYELVNRDRADPANTPETHGRALPLRWNDRLAAVARAHSLDMLNQGYFAHEDPQGRSVAARVKAAGMEWQAVGENIAMSGSVARAEAAFMNEPRFNKNHRANILNPDFTEVGIGIAPRPGGGFYITQDFYTGLPHPGATSALPAGKP